MSDAQPPRASEPRTRIRRQRRLLGAATSQALRFFGAAHRHRRRRVPPGAPPDAMLIPQDAPRPRLQWISFDSQGCSRREVSDPVELHAVLGDGRVDWINVVGFGDEALLRRLGEVLGIHALAMADVVNAPQRPKVDAYGDRHLIILRMARLEEQGIDLQQVSLVLGPGWVVSFEEHEGDVFGPVRERIASDASLLRRSGADFLAYALVDAVVDGFFPVLDRISDSLEELEEFAIGHPEPETLARIHSLRRLLLLLERVQRQQRDAVMLLTRNEHNAFGAEVRPYLLDLQDHAIHVLDSLESFREISVGLMDIYLSSVGIRANDVMKTLTIMASVFIPLSFLAGVYGMNFEYMPELGWRWGYPVLWVVMLGVAFGLLAWFRRRGWLGSDAPEPGADAERRRDP